MMIVRANRPAVLKNHKYWLFKKAWPTVSAKKAFVRGSRNFRQESRAQLTEKRSDNVSPLFYRGGGGPMVLRKALTVLGNAELGVLLRQLLVL